MSRCAILIVFYIALFSQPVKGNGDVFQNIGEAEGLSQRWIRCIYQDRYGFMWFGTKDGLNRYDGYEFRHYKYDPHEKSLASSTINYVMEDSAGQLWVCNNGGVSVYDREKDKFKSLSCLPQVIVEWMIQSDKNTFWFGTQKGLFRFRPPDSSASHVKHISANRDRINIEDITCLLLDPFNNIWIGSHQGLYYFNTTTSAITDYHLKGIPTPYIFDMVRDHEGRIWISEYDNGIFVSDPTLDADGMIIFRHVIKGLGRVLMIDRTNHLWVSWGQKQGVTCYNLDNFDASMSNAEMKHLEKVILSQLSVDVIFSDKWDNKWFGTFDLGLFYQSRNAKKFYVVSGSRNQEFELSSYIVNAFLEDGELLWIGTEYGLDRYNRVTGKVKHFIYDPDDPRSIGSNAIYALTKDSKGRLWIGTWNGGLNLYNPKTEDFTRYKNKPDDPNSIISNNVFSIVESSPGILLLGTITGGGLVKFDTKQQHFTNISDHLYRNGAPYNNSVCAILKSSNGMLWLSSYTALHMLDPATNVHKWYAHSNEDTTSLTMGDIEVIFEDSKKNIWVGTEGGLNCYRPATDNFVHYTMADGLSSSYINSILEDASGNLWIGTNNGINKFINATDVPLKPRFESYSKDDGLPGREFVKRSSFIDQNNRLYFGGVNGFVHFYADSILKNPTAPPVLLTDLYVWNEKIDPGIPESPLPKALYMLDEVNLKYSQNMIAIHFTALNFLNPHKNRFNYKLEGYDIKWIDAGANRSAIYTNLNPGRYLFRVVACNNDGIWNNEGAMLKINISPPWWSTLLARIGYVVLGILIVTILFRLRVRSITRQKTRLQKMVMERTRELTEVNTLLEETKEEVSIQNEELVRHRNNLEMLVVERTEKLQKALKKVEEADKLKSSFLANMSHEIRTPMNAIVGFAALLDDEELDTDLRRRYIQVINSNTETLLVLIDDILEISLIEADQIVLDKQMVKIDTIFSRLEETFNLKSKANLAIEYVRNQDATIVIDTDPVRLTQCLSNLINNAIKFTEEGFVKFGYTLGKKEITCFISDSGIGIEKSELKKIFNQFYKIEKDNNQLYRGTGLGLSITERLVKLMGGSIRVESEPYVGSTFYISLPYVQGRNEPEIKETKVRQHEYTLHNIDILIAEDEPDNYLLIQEILKTSGAKVTIMEDGLKALRYIKEHGKSKHLIVLMDIKMPVMDGMEALLEIRKAGFKIPVIAVTAYARKYDREKMLKAGFTDYIAKPLEPGKLIEIITKNMPGTS